ncbi:hypothetical protein CANARDRAFT_8624 [[Candida] arabinofermentans NRRL YB-2248]|uniref:Homeobox domain-containing protein n=1 Tax=[Candida] arabinofermentans NRRL YB-2248 TaxID=983967 RepID=A0A1E4SYQ1_9ASCO|nr:hypothetical protein CANARDRAFT_8624 [[Candida] arabinofermentans NRRL YB-2248]
MASTEAEYNDQLYLQLSGTEIEMEKDNENDNGNGDGNGNENENDNDNHNYNYNYNYNENDNEDYQQQQTDEATQPRRSRASGDILQLLINEFNKNQNPNTTIRKSISLKTGMSERSVRIWFQNRRAKTRKIEKLINLNNLQNINTSSSNRTTIEINDKYSLIDCTSISIGNWQRIKSGYIQPSTLSNLANLSPKLINSLMSSTDLLIILSKKDYELNYFFSGVFQNEKILFRIFYPILNILNSSLINYQTQKSKHASTVSLSSSDDDSVLEPPNLKLQIQLSNSPKFAVNFLKDPVSGETNSNQWSICEDFSEGQQVLQAFVGEGGNGVGHVLSGGEEGLKWLNSSISELKSQSQGLVNAAAIASNGSGIVGHATDHNLGGIPTGFPGIKNEESGLDYYELGATSLDGNTLPGIGGINYIGGGNTGDVYLKNDVVIGAVSSVGTEGVEEASPVLFDYSATGVSPLNKDMIHGSLELTNQFAHDEDEEDDAEADGIMTRAGSGRGSIIADLKIDTEHSAHSASVDDMDHHTGFDIDDGFYNMHDDNELGF